MPDLEPAGADDHAHLLEATGLLAGKSVYPFVTHAVSSMGRTGDDYARMCPDATVGEGLVIRGEEVADARPDVEDWLWRAGLFAS